MGIRVKLDEMLYQRRMSLTELGERVRMVDDLDGRHAHGRCGLQVHAEIVEEHDLVRRDLGQLARDLVEPRVGLPAAGLRRLPAGRRPRHPTGY